MIYPSLPHCRKLYLREYEVDLHIGAFEHEKTHVQRVMINVDIFIPLSQCTPHNDQLHEVVDYDLIRTEIDHCIGNAHIHLQETLCDRIAQQLLGHAAIHAVRVNVRKPSAYPNCQGVGVEVFHIKNDTPLSE